MSETSQGKETTAGLSEGIAKCPVTCPMCGHRHVQYRLNPQLYWFTDKDIDLKPTGFHSRKSLDGYYPSLYELWRCPQCHYTAHNRVFPDPLKHAYIEKGLVGRRLAEIRKSNPAMVRITETLAEGTSFETTDFVQAIRLSLLEIYFQRLIIDLLNQSHELIARSLLRLAWLFRDWKDMQADRSDSETRLAGVLDAIAPDWPDCPRSESEALEAACKWFEIVLARTKTQDAVETCGMMVHVARIRLKMGNLELASAQLGECQRSISGEMETIARAMNEDVRKRNLKEEERGRLLSDSRKLQSLLEECRKMKNAIDLPRAKALVHANPKAAPPELRKLLGQAGIPPQMIRDFVPDRKTGFFGGLFSS